MHVVCGALQPPGAGGCLSAAPAAELCCMQLSGGL